MSETEQEVKTPSQTDPEWNDYVISLLADSEYVLTKDGNKAPRLPGLRRIAKKLYGDFRSNVVITDHARSDNRFTATARAAIIFPNERYGDSISDVGDANADNCDHPFNKFLPAMAANRAESRALRKLLNIANVTAEELSQKAEDDIKPDGTRNEEEWSPANINSQQIAALNLIGKRAGINIWKFVNSGSKKYNTVGEISYNAASSMIQAINKYNNDEVPKDLKGYDPNWAKEHE